MNLQGEIFSGLPSAANRGSRKNSPLRETIDALQALPPGSGYRIQVPKEQDYQKTLNSLRASISSGRLPYRPVTRTNPINRSIEIYFVPENKWAKDDNGRIITNDEGKLLTVSEI